MRRLTARHGSGPVLACNWHLDRGWTGMRNLRGRLQRDRNHSAIVGTPGQFRTSVLAARICRKRDLLS